MLKDRDKWHIDKYGPMGIAYLPGPGETSNISWGMPAQIFQCIQDKECPRCGRGVNDEYAPFDLGRDSAGAYFGGRCNACDWSF